MIARATQCLYPSQIVFAVWAARGMPVKHTPPHCRQCEELAMIDHHLSKCSKCSDCDKVAVEIAKETNRQMDNAERN